MIISNITLALNTPDKLMLLRATYNKPLAINDSFYWNHKVVRDYNLYRDAIDKQILGKITGVYNSTLDNCRERDMCVGGFHATIDCGKDPSNFLIQTGGKRGYDVFQMTLPSISAESSLFIRHEWYLTQPILTISFDRSAYLICPDPRAPRIYKSIEEKDLINDVERWITQSQKPSQNTKPSVSAASSKPSEESAENTKPTAQAPSTKPGNTSSNATAGSDQTNGLAIGAGCFAAGLGLGIVGGRLYAKKKSQVLSNVGSQPNRLTKA